MTTVISAIPAAIDALIAAFTAAGIDVIDGQGAAGDPAQAAVFVGLGDPDADTFEDAATSDQSWAWIGHVQRDETLEVHCVASAWNGNDSPKTVRDQAFGLVRTVSDAITADPTLGGAVLFVEAIHGLTLRQIRTADGTRADIPFTVTCRARLS